MRVALLLMLLATPAWAEGERALSVGLSYATFSVPGKAMGNMARLWGPLAWTPACRAGAGEFDSRRRRAIHSGV